MQIDEVHTMIMTQIIVKIQYYFLLLLEPLGTLEYLK